MSLIYSMLMSGDGYEVMGSAMNRWSPYVLSILRIITAFLYMVHGTQKLFGFTAPFPVPHLPLLFLAGGMIRDFRGLAFTDWTLHSTRRLQGFGPLLNDGEGAVRLLT
jgi:uncharacterized membrane protein YphA (DoxX/SURF4 family)